MASFRRALVWLGITDEDEGGETDAWHPESSHPGYGAGIPREQPSPRVQVVSSGDGQSQKVEHTQRSVVEEPVQERRTTVLRAFPQAPERPKIHLIVPAKYSDVQEIGDKLKAEQPVIVNVEGLDRELRRRIVDFCSGLAYALEGKLKEIATGVYLLSPQRVEIADDDTFRARQRAQGQD